MRTELQERADILATNLQRSVDACFEVLRSIAQLYAFSGQVNRQDFQRFVQPALNRHPGIHALEWLPRLVDSDRSTFERAVQAEGYPGFQVTEKRADGHIGRAEQRADYFPVHYVEPLEQNRLVLGFDLASDGTRRLAMERARDTGAIAVSGRIELVQATQHQFGFLVILPIYYRGTAFTRVGDRRRHLQGYVLGVIRIADIVRSSLTSLNLENIDFYLHDRSAPPEIGLLATYESKTKQVIASPKSAMGSPLEPTPPQGKAICTRSFAIADRQWSLVLMPTAAYMDRVSLYQESRIRADAATAEAEKLKQALHNLRHTQARWFLEKNLIAIGVGLVLLILGGGNLLSYNRMTRILDSQDHIERSYATLTNLANVLALTTDPLPPTTVDTTPLTLETTLTRLRTTLAHNPVQQHRLDTLEPLINRRLLAIRQATLVRQESDRHLQQQIRQLVREIEQEERSQLLNWETQAQGNVHLTLLIHILGILLSVGLLLGVYYLLQRQVTERQQVEAALYAANSQLEMEVQERTAELEQTKELSDLKLRLFSMVSHEFRTPLSTILVSTQLLTNGDRVYSEEKQIKNLTRIQSAAKTMAQLLSDILTLSRAEAGKLDCRPEPIDLCSFCHHLIDEVHTSTETQHRIAVILSSEFPPVLVDPKLLQSILTNLLSNAIKYSPDDQPIDLILTHTSDTITFQVKDRGIGISLADQQCLYEAFHRGQNVGDVVGTGLGLAVVKTCVDTCGGQISVDSQIGIGTTFTVSLPCHPNLSLD